VVEEVVRDGVQVVPSDGDEPQGPEPARYRERSESAIELLPVEGPSEYEPASAIADSDDCVVDEKRSPIARPRETDPRGEVEREVEGESAVHSVSDEVANDRLLGLREAMDDRHQR
jgi:hypothetical protein